jgi:maleate isomerase
MAIAPASSRSEVRPKRLGMLTPSSNTVLEPLSCAMLAGLDFVSVHFARVRVTSISLAEDARRQFAPGPMLEAAQLLADARVDAICWNGTSAGWLGIESDRTLCESITSRTGVQATSSTLALVELLKRFGITRIGLVTPYTDAVQTRIASTLEREGFACAAERHFELTDNLSFAEVPDEVIERAVRHVAEGPAEAVITLCTNLRAAPLVERLEAEIGLPIFDSVATAMWGALRLADVDPAQVRGWGRLFRSVS